MGAFCNLDLILWSRSALNMATVLLQRTLTNIWEYPNNTDIFDGIQTIWIILAIGIQIIWITLTFRPILKRAFNLAYNQNCRIPLNIQTMVPMLHGSRHTAKKCINIPPVKTQSHRLWGMYNDAAYTSAYADSTAHLLLGQWSAHGSQHSDALWFIQSHHHVTILYPISYCIIKTCITMWGQLDYRSASNFLWGNVSSHTTTFRFHKVTQNALRERMAKIYSR